MNLKGSIAENTGKDRWAQNNLFEDTVSEEKKKFKWILKSWWKFVRTLEEQIFEWLGLKNAKGLKRIVTQTSEKYENMQKNVNQNHLSSSTELGLPKACFKLSSPIL